MGANIIQPPGNTDERDLMTGVPAAADSGSALGPREGRVRDGVSAVVSEIVEDVRAHGDAAVRAHSQRLDRWSRESFRLTDAEIREHVNAVSAEARDDIRAAQANVRRFAEARRATITDFEVEMESGAVLGQRNIPIDRVAVYVPGGRYPMIASATVGIITAKVAGVPHVVACTPPTAGRIASETIAAMHLAGADAIYVLGGVQAIAALALGTETIPAVDFIVGPGNACVAEAKRSLFGTIGIDLVAGPTEILIIAVEAEIERQLAVLPTADVAAVSSAEHGRIELIGDLETARELADGYAFEHAEILTREPRWFLEPIRNHGAPSPGAGTAVAYADKAIGTNHVLPTGRAARSTGGLRVGEFLRTVTCQECTPAARVAAGALSARRCGLENFEGRARSCDVQVGKFSTDSDVAA